MRVLFVFKVRHGKHPTRAEVRERIAKHGLVSPAVINAICRKKGNRLGLVMHNVFLEEK